MTLLELKEAIDKATEYAGDCAADVEVEVWFKKRMYRLSRIGQFSVVPTVTLEIGEKVMDLDSEA